MDMRCLSADCGNKCSARRDLMIAGVRPLLAVLSFLIPAIAYASQTEVGAQVERCWALMKGDMPALEACAAELERIAPDSKESNATWAEVAVGKGRLHDAARFLDRAHAKGLPDDVYEIRRGRVEEWIRIKGGEPPDRPGEQTAAYRAGRYAGMVFLGLLLVVGLWTVLRRKQPS